MAEDIQRKKSRNNVFRESTINISPPGKSVIFLFPPTNCSSPTILKSPFLLQGEFLRKKCSPPRAVGGMPLCIFLRKWSYKRQKNKKVEGYNAAFPKKLQTTSYKNEKLLDLWIIKRFLFHISNTFVCDRLSVFSNLSIIRLEARLPYRSLSPT